ncbi:MAG: glycolate oxidase subunit GlcF [Castellaniella sp.]
MQTNLAEWARDSELGKEAEEILRRCVHCGFCLATCPSYLIMGDERNSPRGRIYLIKQVLEGQNVSQATQSHLDRCLTCRNCETTCPSGVLYGKLVDIGRDIVDEQVRRPLGQRVQRKALRTLINSPLFEPAMKVGRSVRGLMPASLKDKLPEARPAGRLPENPGQFPRQVILLAGCVQPAMLPSIDGATMRVLAALGIGSRIMPESGCCGAVNFHLDAQDAARDQMRRNIDAWLPLIDSGEVEAIVMNATGCGAMVREYDHHLRHDPAYAEKAARVVEKVVDISEIIAPHAAELAPRLKGLPERMAFHPPCTLQHWQKLRPLNERLLADLGFPLQPFSESHLCCGSAGTFSITQPELSNQLRERKLGHLHAAGPETIVSSNIGCITHLQGGTQTPVRHWIEVVDAALQEGVR